MIIINFSIYCGFRCLYKFAKKFTKGSIGDIHSLMLSKLRCRKFFSKKIKIEIIKAIIRRLIKARLMKEQSRKTSKIFHLTKRDMCYKKRSACKKRWHKKNNSKNRKYTIYYRDADSRVPHSADLDLTLAQRKGIAS